MSSMNPAGVTVRQGAKAKLRHQHAPYQSGGRASCDEQWRAQHSLELEGCSRQSWSGDAGVAPKVMRYRLALLTIIVIVQ
jgi:hypothetical protein